MHTLMVKTVRILILVELLLIKHINSYKKIKHSDGQVDQGRVGRTRKKKACAES